MKKVLNVLLVVAIVGTFLFLGSAGVSTAELSGIENTDFDGAEVASFQPDPPGCCYPVWEECCEEGG